jgi:hypothetical protein
VTVVDCCSIRPVGGLRVRGRGRGGGQRPGKGAVSGGLVRKEARRLVDGGKAAWCKEGKGSDGWMSTFEHA